MQHIQVGDLYYTRLGQEDNLHWVFCWQVMRATSHNVWLCQVDVEKLEKGPFHLRDSFYIEPIANQFLDEKNIIRRHVRVGSTREKIISCEKIYDLDGKHISYAPLEFHLFVQSDTELVAQNIFY